MAKVKTPEDFFSEFTKGAEGISDEKAVESKEVVDVDVTEEVEDEIELEDEVTETEDAEASIEEGSEEEPEEEEESEDEPEAVEEEDDDGIVFEDDEEEVEVQPDFESIGKDLGFEGVRNKDEFLFKYNEQIEKAKDSTLDGLPDTLKEAVKFAKEGGDFMAILDATSIDYDKVSNRELVEASVSKYFTDEDGKLDREALDDWFESKGKAEINMTADQIRNEAKRDQSSKIQLIKDKASKEKERMNSLLKSELEKIDSIGGVKLRQSDKDKMFKDTVSGSAMEELFYEDGKISNSKLAKNLFKVRMFEKAISVAKTASKNAGKREVIDRTTNASVKRSSERPEPKVKNEDPLDQFYQMLKNK